VSSLDKALETQLNNIQEKTGKSLAELYALLRESGLEKHGQMVAMAKQDLGLGHGDANTLVHVYRKAAEEKAGDAPEDPLDAIYTGAKADLRPIHDKVMAQIDGFGPFEIAPKKTYLSLRRKKQFAMVGPATNTQVEVGLNVKGLDDAERLKELPPGRMCNYTVRLSSPDEVDGELIGWIRQAYDSAG